ncbi:MAG: choice-of-anchor D domain-containing protein, partial [Candidatus Delongbacteria bacterium]|nr:choice-of-anchor D domain-containing protein [Candidatus Delongbacteria bacterium]
MRIFLLMLMVTCLSLFSANNAVLDASKVTGYRIQSDTDSYLDIEFDVKDISFSDVSTEKGIFTSVSVDGGYLTRDIGSPALPTLHELIAMPYGAEPQVEVVSYDSKVYKLSELGIENRIAPAQPSYSKSSKPEDRLFTYNESAYTASKFNEDAIATVSKSGTMRGVGVGVLKVNPFRYNPTEGTIEVYNDLKVRVNYVNADPRAEEIKSESYSPYFESSLQTLINYQPSNTKADLMNWPVTYLIVCSDALSGNADLQRFIDWKTEKGFNVLVDYVSSSSSIFTNDNWVETQWNTLDPKPSFVLLIGDMDGAYTVMTEDPVALGGSNVSVSDLEYGVIGTTATNNQIPSMYVGRFSVRALGDLTAQVDKTIWYEKEQFTTSADLTYLTRTLGCAGVDAGNAESHGNPQITYGWMHYFTTDNGMNNALYYLYPASSGGSVSGEIISYISNGANFYSYTAHGSNTSFGDPSFTITDINGLNNAGEYPLVVGNCCLTNSFGDAECFGEAWLNVADKGAIGFIGASMSTVWDEDLVMGVGLAATSQEPPPLDTLNVGMYDGVMTLGYSSQAATKHVGLMAVEAFGGEASDYWSSYHLMGDPSVQIYFGIPTDIIASHDGVIAPGATSFAVNTDSCAYIGMTDQNGVLHGAARADGFGVANVIITPYTVGDEVNIVITNQFKKPYFSSGVLCTGDTGGTFAINETNLDYGNVSLGYNSTQQFQISNSHGTEYIIGDITTIAGYTVSVAAKSDIDVKGVKNVMSYSVAPNDSKTFNLVFEPTGAGNFNGDITITSSDTGHATEYIAVTGTGIVPDINLNPTSIETSVNPEASIVEYFDIENTDLGQLDYGITINYTSGKEIKDTGGPDTFGYKWIDSNEPGGPAYNWEDISGTGTDIGFTGMDQNVADIPIGFDFNFYGNTYNTVNVCTNGWISFTSTSTAYTNTTIPIVADPNNMIAAFWDDLDPSSSTGAVYYYSDTANNRFIVSWEQIEDYSSTTPNTFQIILYESGKILFQYDDMQGDKLGCTIGLENIDASDGLLVKYNSAYIADSLAVQLSATPEWLSLDSNTGSIVGIGFDQIVATCDATGLELGVYTADITIASNDPDESTKILPVTFTVAENAGGIFSMSETLLEYGNVTIGSPALDTFMITNSHADETIIGNITTISGYTVSVATKDGNIVKTVKNVLDYTVGPNSSKTFNLVFDPVSAGDHNGNITITSSDTNHATEYIAVTGTCVVPDIDVPASIAASTAPATSVIKYFDIDNLDVGTLDYGITINYTSGKELKDAGGPDTYGYKWIDSDSTGGPAYNWVEINGSGTALGLSDDGESSLIGLGFTFNYYGVDYTSVMIGANGAISFTGTSLGTANATIPTDDAINALISPFWDDLNPSDFGEIYYYYDSANSRFIVEWDGVPDYTSTHDGLPNTFQIILNQNGKIVFQYADMQGELTNCTVGIEDHDGTDGCLVIYDAAYLHNNLAIQFQVTPEWLSLDATSGTVPGSGSVQVEATYDATDLELGVYTADITISSNDPDESTKILPVT